MSIFRLTALSSALTLAAMPAIAITPEEIWEDWQTLLTEGYGTTLEIGGVAQSGETLTISDLTISLDDPDGSLEVVIGELSFENIGDGSVRIRMSDSIPVRSDFAIDDDESASVSMTLGQQDVSLTASGTTDETDYSFDYGEITLSDFVMTGGDMPDEQPVTIDMSLANLSGRVSLTGADVRSYTSASTVSSLAVDVTFSDVEGDEGSGTFNLNMTDLKQANVGTIGDMDPAASLSDLVTSGTTQSSKADYGPTTYTLAADGPDGSFEIASASESGTLDVSFDKDGLSYGTTNRNVTVSVGGSSIPLPPVSLQIAEAGGKFQFPIVPSDTPQGFGLLMNLVGVEVDEALWSIFDPAGLLPRDPANLTIDVSGSGVLTSDFTDPEMAEEMEMAPPGELSAVSVNQLLLSVAGATLTGEGDFTFSNETGVPMPAGMATLSLVGANALIDTLVTMGLVPQEQATGARMMMGLFARPVGEDELVSDIEFTEEGQILANGQRIR